MCQLFRLNIWSFCTIMFQLGKSGENIEAVVRLSSADDEIQRLVDANGNQFVLSKGKDSTRPLEDITLLLVINW